MELHRSGQTDVVVHGMVSRWVYDDDDADLDDPQSVDRQAGLRACAGGRPTAGDRPLLHPLSQGACRKTRAVVMMAGPSAPLAKMHRVFEDKALSLRTYVRFSSDKCDGWQCYGELMLRGVFVIFSGPQLDFSIMED